jgi:eukaryotic-like serine/threonine-protein kinase
VKLNSDQAYATLDPAATFIQPESSARSHVVNATTSLSSTGTQLGRFGILRLHAKGGLGQVSLALDEELQREVALKEIQRPYADDAEARSRFVREAEITGRLEHPGVVPVYGLGFSEDGRPFYAMRFIQGRSLKDAIAEYHQMADGDDQKRLKFRELLRRMIDVCNTMQYAHSHRVIHRDLKPANIMVGEYGETLVVDWGLAKSLDEAEFEPAAKHRLRSKSRPVSDTDTMDGIALGTPQYMSPEQATGKLSAVNSLSDIYSLGATLYHLLVGSPAFAGRDLSKLLHSVRTGEFRPPRETRADVPPPLNSICLKAMALNQEDRFSTAQEMAAELERWLADEPVHVHGEGLAERWYRRLRRHRSWVMGVATMVPLLLVVLSAAAYFVNRERIKAIVQRDAAIEAEAKESKQRLIAEQSEKRAKEQELAAAKSAQEAGRSLANLLITNAENAQAESDFAAAALWAHKALAPIDEYHSELSTTHRIRLGRLLRPLPRPTKVQLMPEEIRGLGVMPSLSPSGQWLVVTGVIPGAFAFDVHKGELAWPSLPNTPRMPLVAFSKDSRLLLTCGADTTLARWDLATGQSVGQPVKLEGTITGSPGAADVSMAISDNQQFIAASTSLADQSLQVECFNVSDPESTAIKLPMDSKVTTLWFMPSNNRLAVANKSGVHFYDAETGKKAGESIEEEKLWTASLSPDASTIVTTSGSGYARLWDATSRTQRGPKLDHRGPVTQAAFGPAGDVLITLSADRSARLWEVATGAAIGSPMDHGDRPLQARFRGDGKAVVTIGLEHKVHVWEVPSTRLVAGPLCHATAPDVAFAGDQLQIAVAGRCITWDLSRTAQEAAIEFVAPDKSEVFALTSFLPQSDQTLMTGSRHAWLVNPATMPTEVKTHAFPDVVASQSISKNGKILATVTQSQGVKIWRLEPTHVPNRDPNASFLTLQSTLTPDFKVSHLRLSSDGQQILVADDTGKGQVWDTVTAKPTIVEMHHDAKVRDSDFNVDGTYVVTGSDDHQLRVWDTRTKSQVGTAWQLSEQPQNALAVSCVRFHPDGKTIAAGSDSDEVVVWNPFNQVACPIAFSAQWRSERSSLFE